MGTFKFNITPHIKPKPIVFEVDEKQVGKISKIIKDIMTSVKDSEHHSFSIPLSVDINSGTNWGELH